MKTILFTLIFSLFALPAFAQKPDRALREHLVNPKHVLRAQKQLNLSKKQKLELRKAIKDAQSATLDLEFELQTETEKLGEIVAKSKVDLNAAETQAKKIMALESKVKLTQLRLAIQTKNLLTTAQLKKLKAFAEEMRKKRQEKRDK